MLFRHLAILLTGAIALIFAPAKSVAQIVAQPEEASRADSIRQQLFRGSYFGLYKDNYFIFGAPVGFKPTAKNSNVKFQISISQRLTKSTLPLHSYLYLFYTQRVYWNVLEKSMPMTDLNFNPGIGLSKPLYVRNRFIGKLSLILEHESNGRDGLQSRSWNKVSFAANIAIDPMLTVHGKVWIPIIDGGENRDILNYNGIYQIGTSFLTVDRKFGMSVLLVKRRGWNLNYNTTLEWTYRIRPNDNQFLFLQYYNGYGEGLLEYNQYHSMLRLGICIKPRIFSEY